MMNNVCKLFVLGYDLCIMKYHVKCKDGTWTGVGGEAPSTRQSVGTGPGRASGKAPSSEKFLRPVSPYERDRDGRRGKLLRARSSFDPSVRRNGTWTGVGGSSFER